MNTNVTTNKNNRKSYRRRIKKLCKKFLKGDREAEKLLRSEVSNPYAKKVIQSVTRSAKKAKIKARKVGIPASNIKSRRKKGYRNAFKTYQGGSPGLGKNS